MKPARDAGPLLPLDFDASDEPTLRAAYQRTRAAERLPFDRAMRVPALAICIRNTAEAIARRRQSATRSPRRKAR